MQRSSRVIADTADADRHPTERLTVPPLESRLSTYHGERTYPRVIALPLVPEHPVCGVNHRLSSRTDRDVRCRLIHDDSTKHLAFKLLDAAQDRWRAVNSPHLVALVRAGARFDKGVIVERKALAGRLHETLESIIGSEALVPPTSTR